MSGSTMIPSSASPDRFRLAEQKALKPADDGAGAIEIAEVDSDALLEQDARAAQAFDAGGLVSKSLG